MKPTYVDEPHVMREVQQRMNNTMERNYIIAALKKNRGNVSKSASELGFARQTLHRKMKKHGISSKQFMV